MHAAIDTLVMTADARLAATIAAAMRSKPSDRVFARRADTSARVADIVEVLGGGSAPDLVVADTRLCGAGELGQLLQAAVQSDTAVVVLVEAGDPQRGIDAIQQGAEDYLEIDEETIRRVLCKVCRSAVTRHRSNPARYLRTMLDGSPDAVITVDRELIVRQANATAARLLQVDPADVLGRSIDALAPAAARTEQRSAMRSALRGVPATIAETERRLPDGTVAHLSLTCLPVTGNDGGVIGACAILHDISETVLARQQLERTLKRQEVAEEAAHVGAFEVNLTTMEIAISPELARLHYGDPQSLVLTVDELLRGVHPDDRPTLLALQEARGRATIDYRYLGPDGADPRLLEISGRWLPGDHPDDAGYFVGIERDVTRQRAQEQQLRFLANHDPLTGALNRRAFEDLLAVHLMGRAADEDAGALLMIDLDGFKHHNDTYGHAVGDAILVGIATSVRERLDPQHALGRIGGDEFVVFVPAANAEEAVPVAEMLLDVVAGAAALASPDPQHPVTASIGIAAFTGADEPALVLRRADEAMYAAKSNGGMQWAHSTVQHQTAGHREADREQPAHPALDTPTGLPGRARFLALLDRRLASSRESLAAFVLALSGIDLVGEGAGPAARDALVREIAVRLEHCNDLDGVLGRLSDSEFAVVLPAGTTAFRERVARRLLACLDEPFTLNGEEVALVPAVGVATSTPDCDAFTLVQHAGIAMTAARVSGAAGFRHYSAELRARETTRLVRHAALRRAITNGEFRLVFQPGLDLTSGMFTRAEALARWHSPTGEVIAPDDFIPLAETTGLIIPLGEQLLDLAIEQAKAWQQLLPHVRIPVNLSPVQLGRPGFADYVIERIEGAGLSTWPIIFEVTESAMMENLDASRAALQRFYDADYRVVIDDFGTGHSSLSRLHEIPARGLKVDKLLVQRLASDPAARTVLQAIMEVAKAYTVMVTAEGIEDAETLRIVSDLGVDYVQGFYLSHPKPAEDLVEFLAQPWAG